MFILSSDFLQLLITIAINRLKTAKLKKPSRTGEDSQIENAFLVLIKALACISRIFLLINSFA